MCFIFFDSQIYSIQIRQENDLKSAPDSCYFMKSNTIKPVPSLREGQGEPFPLPPNDRLCHPFRST